MNTRQAAKWAGITYRQLDYWITQGVIKPSLEYGQGKAREFSRRDLAILRLMTMLRADGYRIDKLKEAADLVDEMWSDYKDSPEKIIVTMSDDPDRAGVLMDKTIMVPIEVPYGGSICMFTEHFAWYQDVVIQLGGQNVNHMKGLLYSVKQIAKEVYQELSQLQPEP